MGARGPRELRWIGSSLRDLKRFPDEVQMAMGVALLHAQLGGKHVHAKPLHGFNGGGVVEIVETWGGGSYRAVYTVRYAEAVYILHAFQKKSTSGIKTPSREIDLVRVRLQIAETRHRIEDGTQRGGRP